MKAADLSAGKLGRTLADLVGSALGELRTNARARLGLLLVAAVIVAALGLRAWSYAEGRLGEIETLKARADELEALGSDAQARVWADAERETMKALARVKSRLWSQDPVGTAHADYYAWVQATAEKAGLVGAQIRLGRTRKVGADGQVTEMAISVFAPSAPSPPSTEAMYAFLSALKGSTKAIHARSLRIQFEPANLLEGEFVAYVASAPNVSGDAANP